MGVSRRVIVNVVGTFELLDFLFFAAEGPIVPGEGGRDILGVAVAESAPEEAPEFTAGVAKSLALRFTACSWSAWRSDVDWDCLKGSPGGMEFRSFDDAAVVASE